MNKEYQQLLRICSYDHGGYVAWGWWKGWDGPEGLKDYMRRSISRLDRFPNLKWGFHVEGATWEWVLANDPSFVSEFKNWVDNTYRGRISLSSGGYGQPLSCTIGEESNIRHLTYDKEAYDRLGYKINIYMQNEHGFFPQMPQLLKQVGIDKAIMRTVWGMYGINPEVNASKVRWHSPEGTWVETIPTYIGGNFGLGKNAWDTRIFIGLEGYIDFEPFRKHYLENGVSHPLAVRIDDYPLPRDTDGSGGFNRLCSYSDMPGYRWVTGEEAFEEIPMEDVDLYTDIDDYPIQMPWGFEGNIFWNLSRQAESKILIAERLAAINTLYKGATWEEYIDRAWKKLLIAQHHDVNICGVSSGGEYGELMLDVAKDFYGEAISLSDIVIKATLRAILGEFNGGTFDRAIVVYNPVGWVRDDIVYVRVKSDKSKLPKDFAITYEGKPVQFQKISTEITAGGYISYTTLAIHMYMEPLSFKVLNLSFIYDEPVLVNGLRVSEIAEEIVVFTDWGKVTVNNETGEYIAYDSENKALLVPGTRNGIFTAVIDEQPCTSVPQKITIEENGPHYCIVHTVGEIGTVSYASDAIIYKAKQRVDFKTTFDVHGQTIGESSIPSEWDGKDEPVVQEKKLLVHFTPYINGEITVTQDFPFSIGETKNRQINTGSWVDMSDHDQGMTMSNKGTMGYLRDGSTLSNILLYSGKYSWGQVQAYLNGSYTLEYSISFHKGNWLNGKAQQIGVEYNLPLVGFSEAPRGGKVSPEGAGFSIVDSKTGKLCENIMVSAIYTRKGKVYLRLYDFIGECETNIKINRGNQPVKLVPVNLLHEKCGDPMESAVIPTYGISTFHITAE